MVLPTFVTQALEGQPLTVFGTGKQSRCFGYVGDAVKAILKLVDTDRAVGEVINIGNDHETTIEELAALVKQRTSSASPVHYVPYDQAYEPGFEDMARRVPSLEKLIRLIDFRPTTSLSVIIDKVIAHISERTPVVQPAPA